jgi:hypothetical protein
VNDDGDRERKRKREVGRRVGERSRDEGTTNDDEEEGKSAPPAVLLCYCGTRESRAAGAVAAVGGTGESLRSGRGRRPCSSSREVCVCGGGRPRDGAPARLQDKEPRSAVVLVHKRYQSPSTHFGLSAKEYRTQEETRESEEGERGGTRHV